MVPSLARAAASSSGVGSVLDMMVATRCGEWNCGRNSQKKRIDYHTGNRQAYEIDITIVHTQLNPNTLNDYVLLFPQDKEFF